MLEKDSVISMEEGDSKYIILLKEPAMDVLKIDFQYEDVFYFGRVVSISSNGAMTVKVKGIYGVNDENDLT